MELAVTAFFDEATNTVSYIVADPATAKAAIVDCVLDFNPKSARTSTCSADRLIEAVWRQDLEVEWILETHAHANHLSAAPYIKEKLGGRRIAPHNLAPYAQPRTAPQSGVGSRHDRALSRAGSPLLPHRRCQR
jgi:glyoxylase-like metal-dependent hydrolase (beta-lactamase superfamily II)